MYAIDSIYSQERTMTDTTQLLSVEEQDICQKIAAHDEDIPSQRAAALLAIYGGSTQAEASEQTGLTVGQIRYLVTTFRKKHLAIFPDDVLNRVQSKAKTATKTESLVKDEASPEEDISSSDEVKKVPAKEPQKKKKAGKTKKSKKDKGKKSKKGKGKEKKDKKGKKSKKSKAKKAGKKKSKK
jgi:hypothetical protein